MDSPVQSHINGDDHLFDIDDLVYYRQHWQIYIGHLDLFKSEQKV